MSIAGCSYPAGRQMLGNVGVSGAPSGKTDEECALAGISVVIVDLAMAV